jgi:phosphoribosylformimino-5-aminoimidazole carboxamide ribonucleotide (ProFAR) isomerase
MIMNKIEEQIWTINWQINQVKRNIESYKENILTMLSYRDVSDEIKEWFKNTCLENMELDKQLLELFEWIRDDLLNKLKSSV